MDYEKSNFQKVLEAGKFAITAEIGPPMSADAENVREKARELAGVVDAANVTDNQTAIVRMSSIAAAYLSQGEGVEGIVQMTMRDRNRLAMQADILGAWALGLKNLLVLSGDHQTFGNHPQSKNVFDVDTIQFLQAINRLQEDGVFMGGSKCKHPPKFFLGATVNPFADPLELQVIRLEKKIDAGARFIQTQCIYDLERFDRFMDMARARGLHERAYMQAGIFVNKSLKSIQMTQLVAGMSVPDEYVKRFEQAEDVQAEGIKIAVELIAKLKGVDGIKGMHIMAVGWEDIVPEIVKQAGFLPRPIL
ncbi:MAG: methylenetetrahydrofolate reductase [Clostridiales bacterium]|nr:methylenetetrahydrofolate reductase [Clostridiales bacterium]